MNSIANSLSQSAAGIKWITIFGVCVVAWVLISQSGKTGAAHDFFKMMFIFIGGVFAFTAYFIIGRGAKPKQWLTQRWQLQIRDRAFQFNAAANDGLPSANWTLPLDAVASVETGRTADFTPSRKSGSFTMETSAYEWQTFLFLKDGTRRPVHHANAARDDCAALAASIREYLDTAAPVVASSAPDGSRPSAFDL